MKKLFLLVLFLVAILLVSCNTETPSESLDDVSIHTHDFTFKAAFDENGHTLTCECGETKSGEHIMEDVNVIKAATCIEEGKKETKCKDCEYSEVVVAKISHDYENDFCIMCGSHKPADGMFFEYSDEYEGWIVKYKDAGETTMADRFQVTELYFPTYTDTGEKVVGIGDSFEFEGRKKVVIPEGIKYILPKAFQNCLGLEEVVLPSDPSSPIEIYNHAFLNCKNLETINLTNSVVYLGKFAFCGCTFLKSVEIPTSITKLNCGLFQNCSSLKKIVIPDTITEAADRIFAYCSSLEEVVIENGITKLSTDIFGACDKLETIVIPDSVTEIDRLAISGNSLKTIVLPKNLKKIYEYAFAGCSAMESITIPKSVEYLEAGIFNSCTMLEEINYEGTIEDWNNISSVGDVFKYSFVKRVNCSDGIIEIINNWPDMVG